MNLKHYFDLYELLQNDNSSKEQRRAFGLKYSNLKENPKEQLLNWIKERNKTLVYPLLSETFSSYLYGITLTLVFVAFVLGLISGIGLLSYNGSEPVNVIYFIAMVVFIPLVTMTLTFFSMIRANNRQSVLIHLSPAFWMEKIIQLLPYKMQNNFKNIKINPLLANWIVIKRSQIIALAFSFGLLFSLLVMVITKDIAFAWSTTLHISGKDFHYFLNILASPWKEWFPWAVPSIELIEQSQYFRLGDKLSENMVLNASKLGEWWKFLAFATLFYAILLRFIMYLLSSLGLHLALKKSLFTLEGVRRLLRDMNESIISTHAQDYEKYDARIKKEGMLQSISKLDASYDMVQGWAMSEEQLYVLNDAMNIITPMVYDVGGTNTLEEDAEIINKSHGEVLLYVKAWEPPTMDFMDYVEALVMQVDKVVIVAVGTEDNAYKANEKMKNIWAKKLLQLESKKVWLKQ